MALSQILKVHQAVYEGTGGLVGHRILMVPTLLLRTTGRRSGATRTNALVYAKDGADYVVVASNGGQDSAPGWLYNVQAKPDVDVQVGRKRSAGVARVLAPGEGDYDRLWRLVNDNNHGRYDAYQSQTERPIPLVVLSPA